MDSTLFIALIIVATLMVLAASFYANHLRTEAIKTLAMNLGFEFCGYGNQAIPSSVWSFDLFNKGRSRRVSNLIRGQMMDAEVSLFDYSYRTGSGKNSHTHRQTVVLVKSRELQLPFFLLTPENIFHKIGSVFGYKDIDFSDYPRFSQRYLLRGTDEDRIRALFNYDTIPIYESLTGTTTEGEGQHLIYYAAGHQQSPRNWHGLMEDALRVYQGFRRCR